MESVTDEKTKKTTKKKTYLRDVKNIAHDEFIDMTLVFISQEQLDRLLADKNQFEQLFKLTSTISTANMHLFDVNGQIKKYDTARDILIDYAIVRLDLYNQRLKHMIEQEYIENDKILEKIRFIEYIIDDAHPLKIQHKSDEELLELFQHYGFKTFINTKPKKKLLINMGLAQPLIDSIADPETPDSDTNADDKGDKGDKGDIDVSKDTLKHYDYLLAMRMRTMTISKLEKLRKEQLTTVSKIAELQSINPSKLWLDDIDEFLKKCPIKAPFKLTFKP